MKTVAITILAILLGFYSYADKQAPYQNWVKANQFYKDKQYDSAIVYYKKIIAINPKMSVVYYNLGNAYYKNNLLSLSILNYQRALFFDPRNKEAKDNLNLAESRIPNRIKHNPDIFFVTWWKAILSGEKANFWALLSLSLFLILLFGIFIGVKSKRQLPSQFIAFFVLLITLSLFVSYKAAQHKSSSKIAVVTSVSSSVLTAPNVYKGQIQIPEGTSVEILEQSANWIKVSLPDKRIGWLLKADLSYVYPIAIQ